MHADVYRCTPSALIYVCPRSSAVTLKLRKVLLMMKAVDASPLIRAEDLRRDFQMGSQVVHALDGVSLTVQEGEFLSVMGPSGSGKSTLLHLLGGLDRPTGGHIWVRGRDLLELDENGLAAYRRQEVGFVFQFFHLIPTMTALENVEFPMLFARVPPAQRRERARQL
ncbi:MAG TPA: ATP-binding cassette domain-containing protein, partial [Chloroflexi bacterium]|nr:ATP-binding cassette domain-containing protein [Chloroflexota bacterium]